MSKVGEPYLVNHTFREEIIVPLSAISDNFVFLLDEVERKVLTGDGVLCDVVSCEEIHVCALEHDIRRLYNISAWDFIKRWYSKYPNMNAMYFAKIKLKKA